MNQKGSGLVIGIVIGALVILGLFGAYYFGVSTHLFSTSQNSTTVIPSKTQPYHYCSSMTCPYNPIPTPILDPTASWQTYVSDKYNFSFRYPQDYSINTFTNHLGYKRVQLFPPNTTNLSITIDQEDKDSNQAFSDWLDNFMKMRDTFTFSQPQTSTISALPALHFDITYKDNTHSLLVLIQRSDTAILEVGSNDLKDKDIFDQILSTFTFTDQTSTPSQSFFQCSQDSDCITVKADSCGCTAGGTATAINKQHQQTWNNQFSKGAMCMATMSHDISCIGTIPQCINNQCQLKKIN